MKRAKVMGPTPWISPAILATRSGCPIFKEPPARNPGFRSRRRTKKECYISPAADGKSSRKSLKHQWITRLALVAGVGCRGADVRCQVLGLRCPGQVAEPNTQYLR